MTTAPAEPPSWARFGAFALLSLSTLVLALRFPVGTQDWPYLAQGGPLLATSEWTHLYAARPDIQVGPLALLGALLIKSTAGVHASVVVLILLAMSYGPVLALALRVAPGPPPTLRRLVLVGMVGVLPWTALAGSGHLDELLALVLALWATLAASMRRPILAGALVGMASAAKPWGVTALPAVLDGRGRRSAITIAAATGTAILLWAPFAAGIYHSLREGYPVAYRVPHGTLWEPWRTAPGVLSSWVRVPQLLASLAAGAALAKRVPLVALLAAFSVRIALDPGQWPYQFAVLSVLAVALDLSSTLPAGQHTIHNLVRAAPRSLLVLLAMLLPSPSLATSLATASVLPVVVLLRAGPEVPATSSGSTNRGRPRPGTTGSGPAQPAGRP